MSETPWNNLTDLQLRQHVMECWNGGAVNINAMSSLMTECCRRWGCSCDEVYILHDQMSHVMRKFDVETNGKETNILIRVKRTEEKIWEETGGQRPETKKEEEPAKSGT